MTATPPGCPAAGAALSVAAALAVDGGCLPTALVLVGGWWDRVVHADLPLPDRVSAALRGRLPNLMDGAVDRAPFLPIDQIEMASPLPFASIDGRWVVVSVTLVVDQDHCYWRLGAQGITDPATPAWTCPTYGSAQAVSVAEPAAAALAGCPASGRPLPVATFTAFPAACFGTGTVELSGWLDTWYVIGGWEAPWTIAPAWLWSMQIGPVPTLSPGSNPDDDAGLTLHMEPGSAVAAAPRNRFVILKGHYARPAESGSCRFMGTTEMSPSEAQADCARAFVVESIRDGEPS